MSRPLPDTRIDASIPKSFPSRTDSGNPSKILGTRLRSCAPLEDCLPMAVIPAGGCFQDRRVPNCPAAPGVLAGSHCFMGLLSDPVAVDKRFFGNTVQLLLSRSAPCGTPLYPRTSSRAVHPHSQTHIKTAHHHVRQVYVWMGSRPVIIPGNNSNLLPVQRGSWDRVE